MSEIKSIFEKLHALGADEVKTSLEEEDFFGKPIVIDKGTTVLPISKISYGYVGGNSDFSAKSNEKNNVKANGFGMTVTPIGLLICGEENTYIKVDGEATEDKWSVLIKNILDSFKK